MFDTIALHNTTGNGYSQDFFVARLNDIATASPGEAVPADGIVVYPNPASSEITLSGHGQIPGETMITILNFRGEQIMQEKFNYPDNLEMDVSNLASGLYLLQIRTNRGLESKKLVIQ